jgi:hypothetical protein
LQALDATLVVVEARFDADERGHGGQFPGTLTDVRALWRPGHESEAFVLNYETRSDALEQLKFKTAWVFLGFLDAEGLLSPGDGSTVPLSMPQKGDRLRVSRRLRLHIVDYGKSGEARRMEAPFMQSTDDGTRLWIAPGTLVQVEEVRVSPKPEQSVWARLSPVPRLRGAYDYPTPYFPTPHPPPPPPPAKDR